MTNERHQKTPMFGDQGFFERGHNVSFSRSREDDLTERLDGIVSIPEEWHKKKVSLFICICSPSLHLFCVIFYWFSLHSCPLYIFSHGFCCYNLMFVLHPCFFHILCILVPTVLVLLCFHVCAIFIWFLYSSVYLPYFYMLFPVLCPCHVWNGR